MRIFLIVIVLVIAKADTNELIWMQMLSDEIVQATNSAGDAKPIPALAESLGLTKLVELVKRAGLIDALSGQGPFTVFGPTNEAFSKLDKKFVEILLKNNTLLGEILSFHVVPGQLLSKDLEDNLQVETLDGDKMIRFNIYKDNTVITAQGRQVIKPDQLAKNGVIHVMNRVLFPAPGDLVYAVSNCPVFSTLAKAVDLAGLVDTLKEKGPFTLFAPTNEAFERLPPGVLDDLLKNKTALADVLTYHVVAGVLYSPGLSSGAVPTVEGKNIQIKVSGMGVKVNNARVIYPDAPAYNGVMHVIDNVLIPPTAHYQMLLKR